MMMTIDIIRGGWSSIVRQRSDTSYTIREFEVLKGKAGVYTALDTGAQRCLLVEMERHQALEQETRGFRIQFSKLPDQGQSRTFCVITCRSSAFHDLFNYLIVDVLNRLLSGEASGKAVSEVLTLWSNFLRTDSREISHSKLFGIFGELYVLQKLVAHNPNVDYWRGQDPKPGIHDFVGVGANLEVKVTTLRFGWTFRIHGEGQLEIPTGKRLFVAFLKLERDANGINLRNLYQSLKAKSIPSELFETKAARAGVTPEYVEANPGIAFRVTGERVYEVTTDFPRITASDFIDGHLPQGISRLHYDIHLDQEPPIPINQGAVESVWQLVARA